MGRDSRSPLVLEAADCVLRSWWTVVAGACFGLAGAVTVLHFLPRTYEATTKIYVAPQKIPPEYVTTTVTDDLVTRLEVLQEAVLSRPYMLRLIEQTYESPVSDEEADGLIRDIRARLTVKVTRAANLFELTYRDGDPQRVAKVVNVLTDLYIQEAAQGRAGESQQIGAKHSVIIDECARVRRDRTHDQLAERRLAAPALADQSKTFTAGDIEIDAVDRDHPRLRAPAEKAT